MIISLSSIYMHEKPITEALKGANQHKIGEPKLQTEMRNNKSAHGADYSWIYSSVKETATMTLIYLQFFKSHRNYQENTTSATSAAAAPPSTTFDNLQTTTLSSVEHAKLRGRDWLAAALYRMISAVDSAKRRNRTGYAIRWDTIWGCDFRRISGWSIKMHCVSLALKMHNFGPLIILLHNRVFNNLFDAHIIYSVAAVLW